MMTATYNIQPFLKENLKRLQLKRKDFVIQSGVPSSTFNRIINTSSHNTDFKTLIKIANYFKVSLDAVLEREKFTDTKNPQLNIVSIEEANTNLKNFLKNKLTSDSLTPYQLSKLCGLGEVTLRGFMKDSSTIKLLSTKSVLALSEHFNISLDEIIGRTPPSIHKTNQLSHSSMEQQLLLKGLDKRALDTISDIHRLIASNNAISTTSETLHKKGKINHQNKKHPHAR